MRYAFIVVLLATFGCRSETDSTTHTGTAVSDSVATIGDTAAAEAVPAVDTSTATNALGAGSAESLATCVNAAYPGFPGMAEQGLSDPALKQKTLDMGIYANAERGDLPCVDLLLRGGANPEGTMLEGGKLTGLSPLLMAADHGDEKMVKLLLSHGADPKLAWDGRTALQFGARAGSLAIVNDLLTRDVDVNSVSEEQFTPLWEAAAGCHTEIVRVLLAHGARSIRDKYGKRTPLEMAKSKGCVDAVSLLSGRFSE